jgi:hypothetical protein
MPEIFNVIQSEAIELVGNTRSNISATGQNATGETANSLRVQVTQEGNKYRMQLFGRPFFRTIETGRRPTPDKKPSREMVDNIRAWCDARGINESAAWAIATKINKQGTYLWRQGGRQDVITPAIDVFLNDVSAELLESQADSFILAIKQAADGNGS